MGNSAFLGAFARAAGIDWELCRRRYTKNPCRRAPSRTSGSPGRAYDCRRKKKRIPVTGKDRLPVDDRERGDRASGFSKEGSRPILRTRCPRPQTSSISSPPQPTSSDIRVIQPESEIAVILMALGCSYAGTPAAVGTERRRVLPDDRVARPRGHRRAPGRDRSRPAHRPEHRACHLHGPVRPPLRYQRRAGRHPPARRRPG